MAEAYQTTRWRTFDGRDFPSEEEANAHEEANFIKLLAGMTVEVVEAAINRDPRVSAISDAIEKAGTIIARKRRADGELRRRPKAADAPAAQETSEAA